MIKCGSDKVQAPIHHPRTQKPTMIDKILWLVFNTQLVLYLFCVIGALATLAWLWDNCASLLAIVKTVLMPYFLPSEGYTLAEKYGNWAGR